MIKNKVFLIVLILPMVFFFNQAKAFLFATPVLNAYLGSQIVSDIAIAATGLGVSALIGQQMGWLNIPFKDEQGNDNFVRMPVTSRDRDRPPANPNLPATKSYDNPDTATTVQSCDYPSSTAYGGSGSCTYKIDYSYSKNSSSGLCDRHFQYSPVGTCEAGQYTSSGVNENYAPPMTTCPSGYTQSGSSCYRNAETSPCGAGYTASSGGCVLTNPKAIPDGKADLEVIPLANGGVAYRFDPEDVDKPEGLTLSQAAALFTMTHPTRGTPDQPEPVFMSVDPSGGVSGMCPYQTCIPIPGLPGHFRISALSNTSTGAQATVIDVNAQTGIVDQATAVPLNGQILSAGATYVNAAGQVSTVQPNQVVLAQAAGGTYTQTVQNAAPAQTLNIPTDYARSGEATTAAKSITDKLAETQNSDDLGEPVLENPLIQYFNPLRSWSVPYVSGTCPTGSFTWNNETFSFDVMCQLFNDNLTIIQGSMSVLYVLAALFIVLGA